ncbi:unnamed protein product, partial [Amoebophrya sp. A25]
VLGEKRKGELRDAKKSNFVRNAERTDKLLQELHTQNRKSVLEDKRIAVDDEEGEHKRFLKLYKAKLGSKLNASKKKGQFDLDNSRSLLTHGGKALDAIGDDDLKRDGIELAALSGVSNGRKNEEDDAEVAKRMLDANFSSGANAMPLGKRTDGGAPFSSETTGTSNEGAEEGGEKTRAEIYQEVMEKSKAAKLAEAREQMKQEARLKDFDDGFDDLMKELKVRAPADKYAPENRVRPDDYDKSMKLFAQEDQRAKAVERAKTEAEKTLDRAQRLAELEKGRVARMKNDASLLSSGGGDNGRSGGGG